ncbi:MAG: hypothetical protein R2731_19325 [Nocardioides sp.]
MAVVAIDGPAHGERAERPDMAPGEYQRIWLRAALSRSCTTWSMTG